MINWPCLHLIWSWIEVTQNQNSYNHPTTKDEVAGEMSENRKGMKYTRSWWLNFCFVFQQNRQMTAKWSTFQNGRSVNASIMFIQTSWTIKERVKVFEVNISMSEYLKTLPFSTKIGFLYIFSEFEACILEKVSYISWAGLLLIQPPSERCCHHQTPLCKTSPNNVCLHFHLFIPENPADISSSERSFLFQPK